MLSDISLCVLPMGHIYYKYMRMSTQIAGECALHLDLTTLQIDFLPTLVIKYMYVFTAIAYNDAFNEKVIFNISLRE